MLFGLLAFASSILSLLLAILGLLRKKTSPATRYFFAGMAVLALDGLVSGLIERTSQLSEVLPLCRLGLLVKSLLPAAWLGFSLTYSRGDYRESLARWRVPLALITLVPIALYFGFPHLLFQADPIGQGDEGWQLRLGLAGKAWNVILLVALAWILTNLEHTFRSAVGAMRWQIKFVALGLAVILGSQLYVRSQTLLYSIYDVHWLAIESSALLSGCIFLVIGYARTGLAEIEVYPSRALLRSSVTILLVGGYLFIVGVLANVVTHLGGVESFQFVTLIVLMGMAGLAVLLLSDRLRERIHRFITRHFARAQHDSVRIWTGLSGRLGNIKDESSLCRVSARLVAETFDILSATIWLVDEQKGELLAAASTAPERDRAGDNSPTTASAAVATGLQLKLSAFDLEGVDADWTEEFRRANPTSFPNGGDRWCVPMRAGTQCLGALVLADRVNGASYTVEELELLECIADQVTSVLLNLRLANEVARSRELEALRTMSAFFVHDLKNAASSLKLMLQNLPAHFDDPAFRQDALRAIGNSARRIDGMIARLTTLREQSVFKPVEADLNQIVSEVLEGLEQMPSVELSTELQPLPRILVDCEQMRSVVTNLVLNARDALGPGGRIRIRTEQTGSSVLLSVKDNGCGMSEVFVKDCLFRPFQSTKKQGLGIGMFQSRTIIESHGGNIRVESETGKGSTFRVSLPVNGMK